jgi:multiple sugar transport system ATP-binding protein
MNALRLVGVTKTYDGQARPALSGLSLDVVPGEFLVLVGPSGCGKSTALRSIAGLEEPDAGEIWIGDRDVTHVPPRDRDIAMVFQNYALYPHMTVFDNLAFGLKLRKTPRDEIRARVQETASLLGLEPYLDRKPRALSGGERQRVALGRALVRHPKVFLFDEPLSNLDAQLRVHMRAELHRIHQEFGATMIYVTHDQVEAMTLGDRIAILSGGLLQQVDAPLAVYDRPANKFVAGFLGSPSMNFARGRIAADGTRVDVGGAHWALPEDARAVAKDDAGREVWVGLRPEHVRITTGGGGSGASGGLDGKVEFDEVLGAETLVYVATPAGRFIARVAAGTSLPPGAPVELAPEPGALRLFDAESEIALAASPQLV